RQPSSRRARKALLPNTAPNRRRRQMAEKLTNIERRVLGHLPAWAEDEAWHVENEGGPEVSIRFYTAPDFTARLAEDLATEHPQRGGPLTEAECVQVLNHLASRGLAEDR